MRQSAPIPLQGGLFDSADWHTPIETHFDQAARPASPQGSPYDGIPLEKWQSVTNALIQAHPLSPAVLVEITELTMARVWGSSIGDSGLSISLVDMTPPAPLVGILFERLFVLELARRYPGTWRCGRGAEKDVYNSMDASMSFEIKTSGQLGTKIYGNRSYAQQGEEPGQAKKSKSGYFLGVNFYQTGLTLVRFGWLDETDWVPQKAETGQMAGLTAEAYEHKLSVLPGNYALKIPVGLIEGVGARTAAQLNGQGVYTLEDLLDAPRLTGPLLRLQYSARAMVEAHPKRAFSI